MIIGKPSQAAFGIGALLLGAVVIVTANTIPTGFGYDTAGPRLLPYIIGGGLILSALVTVLDAVPSGEVTEALEEPAPRTDWTPVALLSATLLLEAALIETLGWVPLGTLVFAAGAWAFGNRRIPANLLVGFLLSAAIQALFTFGLGVDLPLGIFASLLPQAS